MSRKNCKENISVSVVTNTPQLTFQDTPKDNKVNIWGYELCNGAEWKDFLDVVNKLNKENKQLKQQLVEKEKELAYMTKQAKKFNNEAQKYYEDAYCNSFQNQKAIAELEKVRTFITVNNEPTRKMTAITRFINQQIKTLKGE